MKNKKGFTLVELLAVIIILGMLSTIAVVSISRYRQSVNEKEKIALRSSIISAFDNYRMRNTVSRGDKIDFINENGDENLRFTNKLTYNNQTCDLTDSVISYIVKGDYLDEIQESDYVKYGVCSLTTITNEDKELENICKDPLTPSKEEEHCIKLVCNNEEIINDFKDDTSICYYAK